MKDKGKTFLKVVKKTREHLVDSKNKDLPSKLDVYYNSCIILYTLLYSFNISFMISMRFEDYLRKGISIVSDKNVTLKICDLVSFCDDIIHTIKTIRRTT